METMEIPVCDVTPGMTRLWPDGEQSTVYAVEPRERGKVAVSYRAMKARWDGHHPALTVITDGDNHIRIILSGADVPTRCPEACEACATQASMGHVIPQPDARPIPSKRTVIIECQVDADEWDAWVRDNGGTLTDAVASFDARLDEVYSDGGEVLTTLRPRAITVDGIRGEA